MVKVVRASWIGGAWVHIYEITSKPEFRGEKYFITINGQYRPVDSKYLAQEDSDYTMICKSKTNIKKLVRELSDLQSSYTKCIRKAESKDMPSWKARCFSAASEYNSRMIEKFGYNFESGFTQ